MFSGEGPPERDSVEGSIFDLATDMYADGNGKAAGTVGFRGMMNLYGILTEVGGDNVTSQALIDQVRQAKDHPSFWGHDYTCDGNQVPGLPSLCAPQQTLFQIPEDLDGIQFITDWIDTVSLFHDALDE
ncbi:MAG: hypothetical protein R2695_09670 [Acidimicrobiales bacterium]